jgi:hypothetical protein
MHFGDYWNSIEKLGSVIAVSNWGIALSLLFSCLFTIVVIKAGGRKDRLTAIEDLRKAEQIAKLETANLTLRGQVATLEIQAADANKDLAGLQRSASEAKAAQQRVQIDLAEQQERAARADSRVAGLEKDASDAKAAQQRVEIDLAKQQEKTAIAERDLANLKETARPRHLTQEQQAALVDMLSGGPNGPVILVCLACDDEANRFAHQIDTVLRLAGWPASGVIQNTYVGDAPTGAWIQMKSVKTAPAYAGRLQQAFFAIGMPLGGAETPSLAEDTVQLIVSRKPVPPL